ncbi:excinuclease ABC subunit UvrA [Mesomycoplasma ovipneumoniae]|uniref:excinuclease ABC subunit UvrA n=1 Tax=Mesomycoplasma ovipneumoniae TaxID=29562 RepID=UPI0029650749|nr:excinuclease ABC subunit UvrA [Mesomycoplasma ovipneumoniae]MDW2906754.1 excinuclease ABC subunit UvrA [Mesomycoplasma ovipneumoniae]MDW2913641.1 excinuclease ABC subunit UvrA [Mesomycoplasma ovipneumoniae]MDW2915861.1 excinuclease ABC subunit UvrA [Mesomycoplasma ovipneumoniae]MDW2919245.1 excinuclease ABC subunit UvrA [Mesomycoplasma ovipneumoniae]
MLKNKDTHNFIYIKGASENNLKNFDLVIPKNKLVVFTGVSGSGKSSLAFNTIYEEGKRRYIDSLSSYARQFLGGTKKPKVEAIYGLLPTISVEQKTSHNNPRSTVGTITEIYDYFRLLFAKIGKPFCPNHKAEIVPQKIVNILNSILSRPKGTRIVIMVPVVQSERGSHRNLIENLKNQGFLRLKINDVTYYLADEINLDPKQRHTISVIIDRFILDDDEETRLQSSLELAFQMGKGIALCEFDDSEVVRFSKLQACPFGDFEMPSLENRLFSFNSPYGMCKTCKGLGTNLEADFDLVVPDKNLSINQGAIKYFGKSINTKSLEWQELQILLEYFEISPDKKINELSKKELEIINYGSKESINYSLVSESGKRYDYFRPIEGILSRIQRKFWDTTSEDLRLWFKKMMSEFLCSTCQGARLNNFALAVKIENYNIFELSQLSIKNLIEFFKNLNLSDFDQQVSKLILSEIRDRLSFLDNVGLSYLNLSRSAATLSGGESQRIRLASQVGSQLTGVLYVLDEPSIGLHQKDNDRLIATLKKMVEIGNSLIVVEHDLETILAADYLVDIGANAGENGGYLVAAGKLEDIENEPKSITGQFLTNKLAIPVPKKRRSGNGKFIIIEKARENNLKKISINIPLGKFVVITGVSGSGKSTLVNQILVNGIAKHLGATNIRVGKCDEIRGLFNIDKLVAVNQSPIGRTPRSNPATYTSVFDDIREIFANTEQARSLGFSKSKFSFNLQSGRCDKCQGDGQIKIEMHFMPDIYVLCDNCQGKRYKPDVLQIRFHGKTIADILELTVSAALEFFSNWPKIVTKLQTLVDVGLGYIKLGQSATTLSGGEAQRIKLATFLQKKPTGKSLFVLDEPTTGLHNYDVANLIKVLDRIVDNGDSVVIIEHNLDVIKVADYIIDLGPEGGQDGGNIVAKGTPEAVAKVEKSYTGAYLKKILNVK